MSTLAFSGADGDSGAATTDLLHRVDTGDPILNRMETAIDMNGNDIDRAVNIDAQRIVNSIGTDIEIDENLTVSGTAVIDGTTTSTGVLTARSEEHTSELPSLMRISYAVFCLQKKNNK